MNVITHVIKSSPLPPSLPPSLPVCRKLTLETLYWSVFQNEAERNDNARQFVQLVQEQLSKPATEVSLPTETPCLLTPSPLTPSPLSLHHLSPHTPPTGHTGDCDGV